MQGANGTGAALSWLRSHSAIRPRPSPRPSFSVGGGGGGGVGGAVPDIYQLDRRRVAAAGHRRQRAAILRRQRPIGGKSKIKRAFATCH